MKKQLFYLLLAAGVLSACGPAAPQLGAILFFCKHYFKMCGISVLYTCQETNGQFLFKEFHKIFYVII